jgi:hypothetical protein
MNIIVEKSWKSIVSHFDSVLIEYPKFKEALRRLKMFYQLATISVEPTCMAIVGESGCGKTRLLEEFMDEHPAQRDQNGLKATVLRISMPRNPTPKVMLTEMLAKLGDPAYQRGDEVEKMLRICSLIQHTQTKVLVVEEFQHLVDHKTPAVAFKCTDALKRLSDEAKLSMLISGLPYGLSAINSNEQVRRRFQAPVWLERFDWTNDIARNQFMDVLAIWQQALHMFEFPALDSDDMAFRFYCATGGIFGYIHKILRQVVSNAASGDQRTVTLEMLAIAYEDVVDIRLSRFGNPFVKGFTSTQSEEKLAAARQVGVRIDDEGANQSAGGKRKTKGRPKPTDPIPFERQSSLGDLA